MIGPKICEKTCRFAATIMVHGNYRTNHVLAGVAKEIEYDDSLIRITCESGDVIIVNVNTLGSLHITDIGL